ncbi:hypothetical protein BRAS3809_510003 [Bradyrhizobium sp. STM 3809]|nr:hypothetical protein BRAS3809_510003 [Bradyrhizobium sp. STM 3809]
MRGTEGIDPARLVLTEAQLC